MTDTITPQQASARMNEVLVASGVLTPKDGLLATAKAKLTGRTEFEVHPDKINPALVHQLDTDKVLGTREARDALGQDSLVLWSASDVRDVATVVAKRGVEQAPAKAPATETQVASTGAPSLADSMRALGGNLTPHAILSAASGMKNGQVVAGDSFRNGEIPTCQQLMNGHASQQQQDKGSCRG